MPEHQIGTVMHYFGGASVAAVKLETGELGLGDTIRFLGHTTDFTEPVTSMEVDNQRIERGRAGDEVAIQVTARVRKHDKVLKVTPS